MLRHAVPGPVSLLSHSAPEKEEAYLWQHVGVLVAHLQEALNAGTAVLRALREGQQAGTGQSWVQLGQRLLYQ
jgi:hypothetical protein